jgi:hypothetical protein
VSALLAATEKAARPNPACCGKLVRLRSTQLLSTLTASLSVSRRRKGTGEDVVDDVPVAVRVREARKVRQDQLVGDGGIVKCQGAGKIPVAGDAMRLGRQNPGKERSSPRPAILRTLRCEAAQLTGGTILKAGSLRVERQPGQPTDATLPETPSEQSPPAAPGSSSAPELSRPARPVRRRCRPVWLRPGWLGSISRRV